MSVQYCRDEDVLKESWERVRSKAFRQGSILAYSLMKRGKLCAHYRCRAACPAGTSTVSLLLTGVFCILYVALAERVSAVLYTKSQLQRGREQEGALLVSSIPSSGKVK